MSLQNYARVFFTSYPNTLYNSGNRYGNMYYAGVGLGLINCRNMFWLTNMGLCFSVKLAYNYKSDLHLMGAVICLILSIYGFTYVVIIVKTNYLLHLVDGLMDD